MRTVSWPTRRLWRALHWRFGPADNTGPFWPWLYIASGARRYDD